MFFQVPIAIIDHRKKNFLSNIEFFTLKGCSVNAQFMRFESIGGIEFEGAHFADHRSVCRTELSGELNFTVAELSTPSYEGSSQLRCIRRDRGEP